MNDKAAKLDVKHRPPTLVFIHGFLGSSEDWSSTIRYLLYYSCLTIDLPKHGNNQEHGMKGEIPATLDFESICRYISDTIVAQTEAQERLILVGYSLGARLIMYGVAMKCFNMLNIQGVLLEGGNFGLQEAKEKQARWVNDAYWAQRFQCQPIDIVLADWYQQPVFSSLDEQQRQMLIAARRHNDGQAVAEILKATSLAIQPYLLDMLKQSHVPIVYLCGEKDLKFMQLAQNSQLSYRQIKDAGHNAHHEQPKTFAAVIHQCVERLTMLNT